MFVSFIFGQSMVAGILREVGDRCSMAPTAKKAAKYAAKKAAKPR
jgi:hypothetical protein